MAQIVEAKVSSSLESQAMHVCSALKLASDWLHWKAASPDTLQTGARGIAMTLARNVAAFLLCRQAECSIKETGDLRPSQALARFVSMGLMTRPSTSSSQAVDLLDTPH